MKKLEKIYKINLLESMVVNFDFQVFCKRFNFLLTKKEVDYFRSDYENQNMAGGIETYVGRDVVSRFLNSLAKKLNEIPTATNWVNQTKYPKDFYQMECYLESGNVIWCCFVVIDEITKKIIPDKCKIELLDGDYETLIVINNPSLKNN